MDNQISAEAFEKMQENLATKSRNLDTAKREISQLTEQLENKEKEHKLSFTKYIAKDVIFKTAQTQNLNMTRIHVVNNLDRFVADVVNNFRIDETGVLTLYNENFDGEGFANIELLAHSKILDFKKELREAAQDFKADEAEKKKFKLDPSTMSEHAKELYLKAKK